MGFLPWKQLGLHKLNLDRSSPFLEDVQGERLERVTVRGCSLSRPPALGGRSFLEAPHASETHAQPPLTKKTGNRFVGAFFRLRGVHATACGCCPSASVCAPVGSLLEPYAVIFAYLEECANGDVSAASEATVELPVSLLPLVARIF